MVECAGLEIRYTVIPYRGFESLLLRQTKSSQLAMTGCEARRAPHHAGLFFQLWGMPKCVRSTLSHKPICQSNPMQWNRNMTKKMMLIASLLTLPLLQGCTVLAIADVAASTVIYGAKTAVNVLDAVTPDIINKDKK